MRARLDDAGPRAARRVEVCRRGRVAATRVDPLLPPSCSGCRRNSSGAVDDTRDDRGDLHRRRSRLSAADVRAALDDANGLPGLLAEALSATRRATPRRVGCARPRRNMVQPRSAAVQAVVASRRRGEARTGGRGRAGDRGARPACARGPRARTMCGRARGARSVARGGFVRPATSPICTSIADNRSWPPKRSSRRATGRRTRRSAPAR